MDTNLKLWTTIVQKLIEKNLTISTMESCTGGGIANEITNISGASFILKESYITYCNEAKIKQGVSTDVIEKFTVYSKETAIEMAKNAKGNANSNIGIGVTGQLGRIDPNNPVDTLNHVWFAVCYNDDLVVKEIVVDDCERWLQKDMVLTAVANALVELL